MPEPNFSLSYGNVESLVAAILDVPDDQKTKLRARFKQLKRLGFPPGVNVSAGRRYAYDLPATMGCVLVFGLIRAMLLPQQAVNLLTSNWTEIAREIHEVVGSLRVSGEQIDLQSRPHDSRYLVVTANALDWSKASEKASAADVAAGSDLPVLVTGRDLQQQFGSSIGGSMPPPRLIVDLWATIGSAAGIIVEQGWADPEELKNAAQRVPQRESAT